MVNIYLGSLYCLVYVLAIDLKGFGSLLSAAVSGMCFVGVQRWTDRSGIVLFLLWVRVQTYSDRSGKGKFCVVVCILSPRQEGIPTAMHWSCVSFFDCLWKLLCTIEPRNDWLSGFATAFMNICRVFGKVWQYFCMSLFCLPAVY